MVVDALVVVNGASSDADVSLAILAGVWTVGNVNGASKKTSKLVMRLYYI